MAHGHSRDGATNNHGSMLSDDPNRLSLRAAAATAFPPSSPIASPLKQQTDQRAPSAPGAQIQKSPLRRTPSSSSFSNRDRSNTPTMHKRSSYSSLHSAGGHTPPRSPAMRRTSSNLAALKSDLPRPIEEIPPPVVTAASIARQCFEAELDFHHGLSSTAADSKTMVILHDNCYGHRYSRPRTSRAGLATIVERPERIHATILGLATAYVRLGGRHAEGHSPLSPKKHPSANARVPFRIQKTARTLSLSSQAATNIHGAKWMSELSSMCEAAESKLALNGKELTRPIAADQVNGNVMPDRPKLHEGDLYLCSESLNALEGALGGVCEGVDAVFSGSSTKRAFVCIRPPGHHCSADYPSGFCWLNNVHVGIGHAALTHGLTHAAIIDFDLHHGDGSQSITWTHNAKVAAMSKNTPLSKKTAIGYFSLHDINSYPCEMGDEDKVRNASMCMENAHGQTIWNVHLQPWKTEADFWALYESRYSVILDKAKVFLRAHTARLKQNPMHPQPKAAIFLSAGFDASEWESPGMQRHQVNVPTDFYARFTRDVVRLAEEEGLGVDGRVISVLEGGYSDRALMSGVLSHLGGLTAMDGYTHRRTASSGLGQDMARRLGNLNLNGDLERHTEEIVKPPVETFDSNWWALPSLEEIENLVNPPPPAAAPKKQRNAVPPTYSSATQSYSAKIVLSPPNRRSLSGNGMNHPQAQSSYQKQPEQPPPPVGWATAAHELSKLLIPTDRQTKSCKPEDLNAEATRARRDRQSTIGLPTEAPVTDGKRMQLRDRRTKAPKYASEEEEDKPISRSNRRKTIADPAMLAQETEPISSLPVTTGIERPTRPKSRRVSMASSTESANGERSSAASSLGSSVASHPGKDPLVIKKSRVPSDAPNVLPKPKAVNKAPPVPRIPSNYSATMKPNVQSVDDIQHRPSSPGPLAANDGLKNKDIDNLATGMKKMSIKLNLPPKEVQEAREGKAKPAARGRPKLSAPKKNEAITKPKKTMKATALSPTDQSNGAQIPNTLNSPPYSVPTDENTALPEPQGSTGHSVDHAQVILSPTFTPDPSTELPQETNASPLENDPSEDPSPTIPKTQPTSFTAPTDPTIPAEVSPIAPIDGTTAPLPPSYNDHKDPLPPTSPIRETTSGPSISALPSPPKHMKHTRENLPIFTATSPILFGKPSAHTPSIDQNIMPQPSEQVAQDATVGAQMTDVDVRVANCQALGVGNPVNEKSGVEKVNAKDRGIWDVPDTPQVRKR